MFTKLGRGSPLDFHYLFIVLERNRGVSSCAIGELSVDNIIYHNKRFVLMNINFFFFKHK